MTKFVSGFVATKSGFFAKKIYLLALSRQSLSSGFVATNFLLSDLFSSPICRGHNFFILARIWGVRCR